MMEMFELDDDLVAKARGMTGVRDESALVRIALKALIEREASRKLAALGGTMPNLKHIPRRRMV